MMNFMERMVNFLMQLLMGYRVAIWDSEMLRGGEVSEWADLNDSGTLNDLANLCSFGVLSDLACYAVLNLGVRIFE